MDHEPTPSTTFPTRGVILFLIVPLIVTIIAFATLLKADFEDLPLGTPLVHIPTQTATPVQPEPATGSQVEDVYQSGLRAYEQGDYAAAVELFRSVLEQAPDSSVVYNSLGLALSGQGDLEAAALAFQRAIVLDAGHPLAQYNLALALHELGRVDEAENAYLNAIRINPGLAFAHYGLANLLRSEGRLAEAEDSYLAAIQADSSLEEAYVELGLIYAGSESWSKAEEILEAGRAQAPDSLEIQYNLGIIYVTSGEIRLARLLFTGILASDPGGTWGNLASQALNQIGAER